MAKIDWAAKLSSRKFWVAVGSLVYGFLMAFKKDPTIAETGAGLVALIAGVVMYIYGESKVDAARAETPINLTEVKTGVSLLEEKK